MRITRGQKGSGIGENISIPMDGTFKEHSGHPLAEIRGVEGYLRVGQAGFGVKLTRSKTDKAASGLMLCSSCHSPPVPQ